MKKNPLAPSDQRPPLVKSRPPSLASRYQLVGEEALGDEVFLRLRQRIYAELDRRGLAVHRESGRIKPGRPYFYLKPFNQPGWLFERSGPGWVIVRAEKIVLDDVFLREGEALDRAALYLADEARTYPRVSSPMAGGDLVSLPVYEQRLLERLTLS